MKAAVQLLTSWGPLGVFLLAILDSAGVPLPAAVDALLIATAVINPDAAYLAAAFAIAGSIVGCMILFYIARKGGHAYLDGATQTGWAAGFRTWFQTYGLITVFIPALFPIIPLPLKVFVLSAGAMGVPAWRFLAVIVVARVPRYFGMAWLGAQLGHDTMPWLKDHIWQLIGLAFLLSLFLGLLVRLAARRTGIPAEPVAG